MRKRHGLSRLRKTISPARNRFSSTGARRKHSRKSSFFERRRLSAEMGDCLPRRNLARLRLALAPQRSDRIGNEGEPRIRLAGTRRRRRNLEVADERQITRLSTPGRRVARPRAEPDLRVRSRQASAARRGRLAPPEPLSAPRSESAVSRAVQCDFTVRDFDGFRFFGSRDSRENEPRGVGWMTPLAVFRMGGLFRKRKFTD